MGTANEGRAVHLVYQFFDLLSAFYPSLLQLMKQLVQADGLSRADVALQLHVQHLDDVVHIAGFVLTGPSKHLQSLNLSRMELINSVARRSETAV